MFLEEKDEFLDNKNDDEDEDDDNDDNDNEMNDPTNDEETKEHGPSNEMQRISDPNDLTKDITELEKIGLVNTEFIKYVKV